MNKLPRKWYVKDCAIVSKWASDVFLCADTVSTKYLHINMNLFPEKESYAFEDRIQVGFTKITLEDFKELVLKEKPAIKTYTLEELVDNNKVVVFINTEDEWRQLNNTALFNLCGFYGSYCYHLSKGTWSSSSSKTTPSSYQDVELIQFNQIKFKEKTMTKQDFTIEGSEALKKAFVEESGLTDNYKTPWMSRYLCKRSEISGKGLKGFDGRGGEPSKIHFILPSQWEEALEYVKEYFKEDDFKVGDWVIGWHADCESFRTKAWQIMALTATSVKPKPDYGTSYDAIRKATPEEIAAVQTKAFKLGEFTAVVTKDKVEIAGRGYVSVSECIEWFEKEFVCNDTYSPLGEFTVVENTYSLDIGCVKNVPLKDIEVLYKYLKTL